MRFEDLNWFDMEAYLEKDDRVMVVLGSCEQHGYLSLLTDMKIPQAVADTASRRSGVVVAPAVSFGVSSYFLKYPGTISLRIATLMDLVEDVIQSLFGQGFRRFLVLNGHGGNEPVKARMYELANQYPDLRIQWYAWWQSHSVESIAIENELKSYHAGWIEAFPFTQVAEMPDGEKAPPFIPGLVSAEEARRLYGDGVFGGKFQVDESIMEEIYTAMVDDVLQLLKFEGGII